MGSNIERLNEKEDQSGKPVSSKKTLGCLLNTKVTVDLVDEIIIIINLLHQVKVGGQSLESL